MLLRPRCSQSHDAAESPNRMSLEEGWLSPRRLKVSFTFVCASPQIVSWHPALSWWKWVDVQSKTWPCSVGMVLTSLSLHRAIPGFHFHLEGSFYVGCCFCLVQAGLLLKGWNCTSTQATTNNKTTDWTQPISRTSQGQQMQHYKILLKYYLNLPLPSSDSGLREKSRWCTAYRMASKNSSLFFK